MKYLLVFALLCSTTVSAQQHPVSGMYWNNYSYFNPAMSGVKYQHEANVTNRGKWSKVNDQSRGWFVNYGINLGDKHGLGVNYVQESVGFRRIKSLKLNYNYQVDLKEERKLVVGTALSLCRNAWASVHDWHLIYIAPQNTFQFDLGIAYYSKKITAGLAITQLPISHPSKSDSSGNYHFTHLTGNFRYEGSLFNLPELILETKFQTDFIRYRQDFNIGYKIKNTLEVGIGYRTTNVALVNLTGIIAKNFRVGYSYAHSLNNPGAYSRSTHEIAIGFRIPGK